MLRRLSSRTLSATVLILIIVYGILRIRVRIFFADLVYNVLDMLGYNPDRLILWLNDISRSEKEVEGILGWFIYYPTYFLLHIVFILLLFNHQKKVRNYLVTGLTALVALLIVLILAGKLSGLHTLYLISYEAFQNLFGLPFILLFIEGGRILYRDIFAAGANPEK